MQPTTLETPVLDAPNSSEDLFTAADLRQMAELGIEPGEALRQIELFRNPPPFTRVLRPCTPGDGIRMIFESDHDRLLGYHEEAALEGRIGKLVPASGAASRMFKALLEDLNSGSGEPSAEVRTFLDNLPRFAFAEDLAALTREHKSDRRAVLAALLTGQGLGYAELPKALLKFHRYPDGARTSLEEHLVEAAAYTQDALGVCRLHFTVTPGHEPELRRLLETVRASYEERLGVRFDVSFSYQERSTDTLAVDLDNRPFRLEDGTLLFRPGGHGALIHNLQALATQGWDIVLLKNIDNVVPDDRKATGLLWKKLLAGALLALQKKIFGYLKQLEDGPSVTPELLEEVEKFMTDALVRPVPAEMSLRAEELRLYFLRILDRPLRVCGVVRNQGEPGGGPFWVEAPGGEVSLQIVETSQIDPKDPDQQRILRTSTHFNPVDLACALRDRHGRPYNLEKYIDPTTVFISRKSHEGRPLKALERPGLWNGAMAEWNTVFVEVPDATFAPVKTVLDLLRPEHQA
ncbi:MAG TPA: DUF4301 family protein [Thermoanaerobaculia bacterium]|nr:DUF4301 family protein [Thermoanaerobaculia bacterium]